MRIKLESTTFTVSSDVLLRVTCVELPATLLFSAFESLFFDLVDGVLVTIGICD